MKLYLGLFFLFLIPIVHAQAIGVSPSSLSVEVYRGEEAIASITVVNPSEHMLEIDIEPDNYQEWFSVDEDTVMLAARESKEIKVHIKPDALVQNGNYQTLLLLHSMSSQGGYALNVGTAVKIDIRVSGKQKIEVQVQDCAITPAEEGSMLMLGCTIMNNGNVRIHPTLKISGQGLAQEHAFSSILPQARQRLLLNWTAQGIGNYSARCEVLLGNSLVYSSPCAYQVFPYGAMSRNCSLHSVNVSEGEVNKLSAMVVNDGQIASRAYIEAELYCGKNLISAVKGNVKLIGVKEAEELIAYINNPGQDCELHVHAVCEDKETEKKIIILKKESPNPVAGIMISFSIVVAGAGAYASFTQIKKKRH